MKLTWNATVAMPPKTLIRHPAFAISLSHFAIPAFVDASRCDLAAAALATGLAARDLQFGVVASLFARPRVPPPASSVGLVRAICRHVYL